MKEKNGTIHLGFRKRDPAALDAIMDCYLLNFRKFCILILFIQSGILLPYLRERFSQVRYTCPEGSKEVTGRIADHYVWIW
jgi:hypothetical protein